jgi:hypothetical protein
MKHGIDFPTRYRFVPPLHNTFLILKFKNKFILFRRENLHIRYTSTSRGEEAYKLTWVTPIPNRLKTLTF